MEITWIHVRISHEVPQGKYKVINAGFDSDLTSDLTFSNLLKQGIKGTSDLTMGQIKKTCNVELTLHPTVERIPERGTSVVDVNRLVVSRCTSLQHQYIHFRIRPRKSIKKAKETAIASRERKSRTKSRQSPRSAKKSSSAKKRKQDTNFPGFGVRRSNREVRPVDHGPVVSGIITFHNPHKRVRRE